MKVENFQIFLVIDFNEFSCSDIVEIGMKFQDELV